MRIKRVLILAPLLLLAVLLQSYLWVPTYDRQARGNRARLRMYVDASIGDAQILNPVLSADSASSTINGQVFDTLLDFDENLELRGRLATEWEVREVAYLLVNPEKRFPDGSPVTGPALVERLRSALAAGNLPALEGVLTGVTLLPPESRSTSIALPATDAEGAPTSTEVAVEIDVPERVELRLSRVDQDLFERLAPVIGDAYAAGFPHERFVRVADAAQRPALQARLPELLPVEEHNPVIRFRLRPGVRFHDGHAFSAEDVAFTYRAIMDPKSLSPRTSDFEPIQAVEVLDPQNLRVVYKRLFSPAVYAWAYMGILPKHRLDAAAMRAEMDAKNLSEAARARFGLRDMPFNRAPVGTGPFRFVEWQTDELIHLRRFDDYWEGPPEYADYYFRIVPDLLTQEVEFRTGAIDAYGTLPYQVARYRDDPRYQSFSSLGFGYSYIGYNQRKPLFADPRVRRALGMAIDVDEIIQYILYGEGERVTGPYPKNTDWYDPDVEPLPYDPEGALRLLEEAGWRRNADGLLEKDGRIFEFNLITNNGNPIRRNILTIAQNAWRKIGIRCNTQLFEWAVFLTDFVNTGDFDALVLGWSMGLDPDLYQIFHSSQTAPQKLNFAGYASAEADELITRIRREYDRDEQVALTRALHRRVAQDQPYTFLFAQRSTQVLDEKIVIVRRDADGSERYEKIEPVKGGRIAFHFNRWRKLEHAPRF